MCGIFGVINREEKVSRDLVQKACDLIAHRGPDDKDYFTEGRIGFGHRRLSIVDLSEHGRQPMISADGNYVLIFNGEIYNHLEIRHELYGSGYQFKGTCDTETLLYGYIHYGKAILTRLNGIFSFAVYDKIKREIFIARDQYGIKPLYYYHAGGTFALSSEIKTFTALEQFDQSINYTALVDYINFLWCPGENTPFLKVKKLLPGHSLLFNIDSFSFQTECYYDVPFNGNYAANTSEKDLTNTLETKIFKAVERQLMSDVPLGFFVSGGLDSSLIAAIAQQINGGKKITAFTIDPGKEVKAEGFSYDLDYAVTLSKTLGFDLSIVNSKVDILADFDKMIWHLDEPQADPAPLSVYNISRLARQNGIKVLLGGTAGDDIFSGYRRHQALRYNNLINKIPAGVAGVIKTASQQLDSNKPFNRRLKKILKDVGKSQNEVMAGYFSWIPLPINKSLFLNDIAGLIETHHPGDYFCNILDHIPKEKNSLNKLLYMEMKGFLPDHNLNYTDKMSMAAGVEARVPYLDVDLVNFSTTIPPHLKMKGTTTKYLLKKVAEKFLPREIIYRSKAGFGAPVRKWIVNDMDEMIHERLSPARLNNRGIFNSNAVQQLIGDNKSGKVDGSYTIWSLLAIESWMEQFVDGKL